MDNVSTKTKIANSFKSLMKTKPIAKITVSDIIKDCNINRNTFYYHFVDIVDLFKWIHQNDVIFYVKNIDITESIEEVILFVIEYLNKNRLYINSAFNAFSIQGTKRIFLDDFIYIAKKMVATMEANLNISVKEDYKEIVYMFYTEAVFGLILIGLQDTKDIDTDNLVSYIRTIIMASLPSVLSNGPQND